ncbi:5-hydroxytryptamine receptor 7-like [Mustelus asterias]
MTPVAVGTPAPMTNHSLANGSHCAGQVLSLSAPQRLALGLTLTLIAGGTVGGNVLAIAAVCVVQRARRLPNYLLAALAGADLSVALTVLPFAVATDLAGGQWLFGATFCDVFIALDVVCCTASIMTLCLISVDRYLRITRPLTYSARQSGRTMAKMVGGVWIFSACVTLPPLFGWARNVNGNRVCLISQDFGYTVYSTVTAFYLPTAIMLAMYYKIFREARRSAAALPSPPPAGCPEARLAPRVPAPPSRRPRRAGSLLRGEEKAAATLGTLLGVFAVCWLPFFVQSTARPFICGVHCSCLPVGLERALLWLGYANSLLNPFIYAFFSRDLRSTYKDLLRGRCRKVNRKFSRICLTSSRGPHAPATIPPKPYSRNPT